MKPAENIWLQQGPTDLSKIERLWCFYKLLTFAVFRIWTDITHNYGHTKDLLVKTNSWWDTDVCEDHTHVKKKKIQATEFLFFKASLGFLVFLIKALWGYREHKWDNKPINLA